MLLGVAIIGAMPVAGFAQSADSEPRPWYERIEFGAAWRKTSKEKRDYISFKLNPVVAQPVYLRLFESETVAGEYELLAS